MQGVIDSREEWKEGWNIKISFMMQEGHLTAKNTGGITGNPLEKYEKSFRFKILANKDPY